ncbi:Mur ligase [Piedraia hortae CBS 480.64]|uniref:tetrahydrofolate synthase n=1 Tax=Piedraia hortae CBS 480.64 TaxID=1314780 RepID=A0A6A7BX21_9PEZI|nr:Mur ligase [Piedraia hortae CBS 480.64]
MAFHTFMKANLDSAVIECGIGGEYDSTNIIEEPLTTGVTSLGIDHEGLLGRTIEEIAWHKAGIFKRRVPAFTVPQSKDAEAVLYSRAKERGTELNVVTEHTALKDIKLGIKGPVQRINASLAIAVAASHLSQMGHRDVPDPLDNISNLPPKFVKGLEKARLGGRCDKRSDAKVPNLTWFLDGGHTRESIELAGRWFAASRSPNALQVLIFNQQTRDARALARQLRDSLDKAMGRAHVFDIAIFCPNVTYENAGYKADLISINVSQDDVDSLRVQREMAEACKEINPETKPIVCGTIEEAVARVRKLAGRDTREVDVLVTGSLHLVGGLIEVVEAEVEREEML